MKKARQAFRESQKQLKTERLIFLDEMGVHTAMNQLYGWSRPGEAAVLKYSRYGKRLNVVGAIGLDGVCGHMSFEGSFDTARMVFFIHTVLGPWLQPGDQVVMDGLRVHATEEVRVALETYGATPLILPPYSPELNPIEHTWSTMKARLRAIATESFEELGRLVDTLWEQMAEFCPAWIRHCGYSVST